jgi:hypothetical protein
VIYMDTNGRVTVLLSPREAQLLSENLPVEQLEEEGNDVESLKNRLQNAEGGKDLPRDLAGRNRGFEDGAGNGRVGVWKDSGAANPGDYKHGYAAGM